MKRDWPLFKRKLILECHPSVSISVFSSFLYRGRDWNWYWRVGRSANALRREKKKKKRKKGKILGIKRFLWKSRTFWEERGQEKKNFPCREREKKERKNYKGGWRARNSVFFFRWQYKPLNYRRVYVVSLRFDKFERRPNWIKRLRRKLSS
jgi:hypothetical protein